MYEDVVTVFNRRMEDGELLWYPTVIEGVHICQSFAAGEAAYGRSRDCRAAVLIPYVRAEGAPSVAGKLVLPPRLWRQVQEPALYVTFAEGEDFDFFIPEDWLSTEPVRDADYPGGFYGAMAGKRGDVYAVAAVCRYSALPHYEITGR